MEVWKWVGCAPGIGWRHRPWTGYRPARRRRRIAPTAWKLRLDRQAQQAKEERRTDRGWPFDGLPLRGRGNLHGRRPRSAGQEHRSRKVGLWSLALGQGRRLVGTELEADRLAAMLYGFTALAVSVVVGRPGIVLTWRDA
jgi:hypothetical protein